jgi:hypothetical protein
MQVRKLREKGNDTAKQQEKVDRNEPKLEEARVSLKSSSAGLIALFHEVRNSHTGVGSAARWVMMVVVVVVVVLLLLLLLLLLPLPAALCWQRNAKELLPGDFRTGCRGGHHHRCRRRRLCAASSPQAEVRGVRVRAVQEVPEGFLRHRGAC